MNREIFRAYLFVIVLLLLLINGFAQKPLTRVLFVFDASNSMKVMYDGKPRIEHAKQLFTHFIDSLSKFKNYEFALRMYGSTVKYPPGDCKDSKLVVPFGKNNLTQIKAKVNAAKPTGITPIEHSLTESANDFPDNKSINTIILITDGIEECGGDPCKAREKLMEKGIIFKPCVIGIGLTVEQAKTFECVGNYFNYEDASSFNHVVNIVTTQQLNKTTAQVNLLDISSKPTESNVNVTFYDQKTGEAVYNYLHALNKKGNPDTIPVDEFRTYKVVAHTIPPVFAENIKLNIGTHNIIPVDAPQGYLEIKRPQGFYNFNEKIKCIVRKAGTMNTLHIQNMNSSEKYIVGEYDLEVLTLPRTYLYNVKINQSITKSIPIDDAGMVKLTLPENGDGCILQDLNGDVKWLCNLQASQLQQIFYLQPGNYRITFRSSSLKQSIYTIEKKFSVKANEQLQLYLTN